MTVRTMVRQRVAQAGAQLDFLVLASEPAGCVGVDMMSGAFVRARHPAATRLLRPFQIARARLAHDDVPDAAQPELVDLAAPPRPVGRVLPRRAERRLRPLLHPPRLPLLGFSGNAVPYWTLEGNRPSVALIEPERLAVGTGEGGHTCRFLWRDGYHELPLLDWWLLARLGDGAAGPRELARLLGHAPDRLVVALTPPMQGYCYKAVVGVLPRR
jgi:hypothetical protein